MLNMDVVSFFAGCGGLDLGFRQAGLRVIWANDIEPDVKETYERNHPDTESILGDITGIAPDDIPDCDGFIGGPPCQSWSIAGKQRGLGDKRGRLFLTYIDLIKAKQPKFFLIENVKGILADKFQDVFNDFLKRLDDAGYAVNWKLLDAADYRVPQNRERVFIIGFRKDLNINFCFPAPTCSEPITLTRGIGDITEQPRSFISEKILTENDVRPNHDVYAGPFGPYYNRGNRRRPWERPSFTIHATGENAPLHPGSPKMIFHAHGDWHFQMDKTCLYRRLSVRECARIQTFPDSFVFVSPDIKALYKMIGNAVPPRLGFILAKSVMESLSDIKADDNHEIPENMPERKCVLVGYYKDARQLRLILENLLYYVRSDGRYGSVFKENCAVMPDFLLLHNKDDKALYELDGEDPILADNSFLKSLGFRVHGETYLCFRLRSSEKTDLGKMNFSAESLIDGRSNFKPYFVNIEV